MNKWAIIIGISYKGSDKYLKGCMNDVNTIYKLLISWGYNKSNILVLADDKISSDIATKIIQPTSFNINQSLNAFVKHLNPEDKAFIYYSGHGSRTKHNGREESCIVPQDFKKSGMVSSETIRYYLNKIPSSVNVFCLFDCCNSGTVCDLKYHIYDTSFKKNIKTKIKKFDYTEWEKRQYFNVLNTSVKTPSSVSLDTLANIVSISGCWDTQFSYDLGYNGALTAAFMKVIQAYNLENLNFFHLIQDIRGFLIQMRISQSPQLMYGRELNLKESFRKFIF